MRGRMFRASCQLAGGLALLTSAALAQGKMPFYLDDTVVYGDRVFNASFALFEREEVRAAPVSGAPQKEWVEESSLSIYAVEQPDLGDDERALALKLSRAFCAHHGLTVRAKPERSFHSGSEWTFYNLCWKDGW